MNSRNYENPRQAATEGQIYKGNYFVSGSKCTSARKGAEHSLYLRNKEVKIEREIEKAQKELKQS